MENYQQLALLIDEMIDEGIVINTDSESLENKVYLREAKSTSETGGGYFKSVNIKYYNIIYLLYSYSLVQRV